MTDVRDKADILAVASALIAPEAWLSREEQEYFCNITPETDGVRLAKIRSAIFSGADPLGDALLRVKTTENRRVEGATYTPASIVRSMVSWADSFGTPARVVDPGSGTGRFLIAAAKNFTDAQLVAIELDPLAAIILRANLAVHELSDRTEVIVSDFREAPLPSIAGQTVFLGNPPYVRHHHVSERWKSWYRESAARRGIKASTLAGSHIHFFFRTRELARSGDYGSFITSSEWLDTNYGSALRNLLADGLGGQELHILDPTLRPFPDVTTTGAITCFQIDGRTESLKIRSVRSFDSIGSLGKGKEVLWDDAMKRSRWSSLVYPSAKPQPGYVELGEVCRVHRGQVTGGNKIWIANGQIENLPISVLFPTVTKARDIMDTDGILADTSKLKNIIDLPVDLEELTGRDREAVERFLIWAMEQGGKDSYTARHRKCWWKVGLSQPAPILCTYMARRTPTFVRNVCEARHINIVHGLYPRDSLSEVALASMVNWLNRNVDIADGRTYAGGLTKFEPRELERVTMPHPERLII